MTLKLTLEELRLLASMASNQLFRKEFIDPRMPGYRPNPEDMNLAKSLVGRLRLMVDQISPKKKPSARGTGWRAGQDLHKSPAPSSGASSGTGTGLTGWRHGLSQENV